MAEKDVKQDIKLKNPKVGTKIKAVPKPEPEIGIDTKDNFLSTVVATAQTSNLDISKLEGFSTVTQNREQIYRLIDTMAEDPILSTYLKTLAGDAVEPNDSGQIVWAESDDSKCAKYVTYLLDAMNIDKNAYKWMHSLIKYGDLYLRLYRESDYEVDELFKEKEDQIKNKESLHEEAVNNNLKSKEGISDIKENVNIIVHDKKDHYVNYVELVPNPGEMFELTKFGKTQGYIQAPIIIQSSKSTGAYNAPYLMYRFKQSDVNVYGATEFVHGCLDDNSSRVPEEVDIFLNDEDYKNNTKAHVFTVKRGQSELASVFKIWRELSLLENSALLNRITKSAISRIIEVEVGDMPKEQIGPHLQAVKSLFEQKMAVNTNSSIQEYTNPGPIENDVYLAVREGKGHISTTTVGGDFDPKQLTDIEHFQDKLFGALGVPKAFFGVTGDGAGFNGGESLAIQDARYGKSLKRFQNAFCQAITDLINLMLFDRGLRSYINKFTIRMQAPVTKAELDRREDKKNRIGIVNDIMMQLQEIQDTTVKLKILKSLLADSITDVEVVDLLQDYIDKLESSENPDNPDDNNNQADSDISPEPTLPSADIVDSERTPSRFEPTEGEPTEPSIPEEPSAEFNEPAEDSYLPSGNDLGVDLTNNSQF